MLVEESGYVLRGMEHGGTPADKTTALCPSDQRPSVAETGFGKVEKAFNLVVLALRQTCLYEAERTLHGQNRVAELMNQVGGARAVGVQAKLT